MSEEKVDHENWWHRLFKVVYVLAYIIVGLLTLAQYSSGAQTHEVINPETSYVVCSSGQQYSLTSLGIKPNDYLYFGSTRSLYSYDDNKARGVCKSKVDAYTAVKNAQQAGYSDNGVVNVVMSNARGDYRLQVSSQTLSYSKNPYNDAVVVFSVGAIAIEITKGIYVYITRGNR